MVAIDNCGPTLREESIKELEVELGASLDLHYREFLKGHNGGTPTPNTVDVQGLPGSPTDVQVFFGIDESAGTNDLSWNLAFARERFPRTPLLPIACDSAGGLFCLEIRRGVTAKVVFCEPNAPSGTLFDVADDFREFRLRLREFGN
jgi:SMI1-KNR4 cell-wall